MIPKEPLVVCTVESPTPVAFINVYETGDMWVKIKGCMDCPEERRAKCCGNCYWLVKGGYCHWQQGHLKRHSSKPWWCVIAPTPDDHKTDCVLEFQCTAGSKKGMIRRVQDKRGVFVEPS